MEKALERVINNLPRAIIMAVVAVLALAWGLKELRSYASYGDVFRDPVFLSASLAIVIALLAYYGVKLIVIRRAPKFSSREIGILVTRFEGDTKDRVQTHTVESIKSAVYSQGTLADVGVKKARRLIHDHQEACTFAQAGAAHLCIWGVLIPPRTVHFNLSIPGKGYEARALVPDFPDISLIVDQVVKFVNDTLPPMDSTQARIMFLERRLEKLGAVNAENEKRIRNLYEQIHNLETEIYGRIEYESELTEIRRMESHRRRIMLIIGISEYQLFPRLRYPAKDARAIAEMVQSTWGRNATVTMLVDSDATAANISRAMQQIALNAHKDDQVWLYYSGHAFTTGDGTGYILPCDGNARSLPASAIPMTQIGSWFKQLRAQQAIMFADACHSGAFGSAIAKSGVPAQITSMRQASGRVIITAGGASELAYEDQSLEHGVFTHYLLKGLTGEADFNKDEIVTTSELFEYLYSRVSEASTSKGFQQRPIMWVVESTGDFVLALVD